MVNVEGWLIILSEIIIESISLSILCPTHLP